MRGKMLCFNEKRDLGLIRTDEGERLSVLGPSFAGGKRPQGRCAQAIVDFVINETSGERQAKNVNFVEADEPRRARMRSRVIGRR